MQHHFAQAPQPVTLLQVCTDVSSTSPQVVRMSTNRLTDPVHENRRLSNRICVANQQLLVQDLLVPKGTEVNSRGRALCAKPTGVKQQGLRTLKGVKQPARFDPFRVGRCNRLVPWASRKALTHGY